MSYIFGLIVVALFFTIMHYFTELDTRQKVIATVFLTLLVVGAVVYNEHMETEREHILAVELKYSQNRNILCNKTDVNKSTFSYSVGTQTFIGRKNTPYYNQMYSVDQCR
jgi:hypothetical protein